MRPVAEILRNCIDQSEDVDRIEIEIEVGVHKDKEPNVTYRVFDGAIRYHALQFAGPNTVSLNRRPESHSARLTDIVIGKRRFELQYDREVVEVDGDKVTVFGHLLVLWRV